MSQPVSPFQLTLYVQMTILRQVSFNSSIPPLSGQRVPLPGGKDPNTHFMLGETNFSGLQTHMVGVNQPFYGVIPNPAGSFV